ncbi:cupin domain-containing protein [Nonomuraea turcica]|uniref:cupin domain-containing protein n=1 Tax=Nonomuraea sp. G32 TaxID=3067274 RepID=UPI00273B2C25|nr:cupin domain-containing protein [Nonomuraea sp. G32]MDP4501817.1 cupin domain-containing protein [Nonomuraea sp. G32]
MPIVLSPEDVVSHDTDARRIWRLLTPETCGANLGAVAGLVAYKYRSPADEPPAGQLGEGHARAEFYYVTQGAGVVRTPAERLEIAAGQAFVIEAGIPHTIWSDQPDQPVLTFYVSLK